MRIITKLSLISLFLLSLLSSTTFAESNWQKGRELKYDLVWEQIPAVCGTTETIQKYLDDNSFMLYTLSIGRSGASDEGQPVYVVSTFITPEEDQQLIVISVPGKLHTCMIAHSFDLKIDGLEYDLFKKNSR